MVFKQGFSMGGRSKIGFFSAWYATAVLSLTAGLNFFFFTLIPLTGVLEVEGNKFPHIFSVELYHLLMYCSYK